MLTIELTQTFRAEFTANVESKTAPNRPVIIPMKPWASASNLNCLMKNELTRAEMRAFV